MNTAGEINTKSIAIGTWANLTPKQIVCPQQSRFTHGEEGAFQQKW